MTTLYAFGAVSIIAALAIWFAIRSSKAEGRAEVVAEVAKKGAEDVAKADAIVAEHRTDADTVDRLQRGDF